MNSLLEAVATIPTQKDIDNQNSATSVMKKTARQALIGEDTLLEWVPRTELSIKNRIDNSSAEKNKQLFAGKTVSQLAAAARRHGYGDNNVYLKYYDLVT